MRTSKYTPHSILLHPYSEIVGILKSIKKQDEQIKIVFTITQEIDIPSSAISYKTLQRHLGNKIGLLNLNGKYKLRKICPNKKPTNQDKNTLKVTRKPNKKTNTVKKEYKQVVAEVDDFLKGGR